MTACELCGTPLRDNICPRDPYRKRPDQKLTAVEVIDHLGWTLAKFNQLDPPSTKGHYAPLYERREVARRAQGMKSPKPAAKVFVPPAEIPELMTAKLASWYTGMPHRKLEQLGVFRIRVGEGKQGLKFRRADLEPHRVQA